MSLTCTCIIVTFIVFMSYIVNYWTSSLSLFSSPFVNLFIHIIIVIILCCDCLIFLFM